MPLYKLCGFNSIALSEWIIGLVIILCSIVGIIYYIRRFNERLPNRTLGESQFLFIIGIIAAGFLIFGIIGKFISVMNC